MQSAQGRARSATPWGQTPPKTLRATLDGSRAVKVDQMNNPKEPTTEEIIAKMRQESPEDADVAQKILDWSRQHFEIRTTPEGWNIVPVFKQEVFAYSPFVIQKEKRRALYMDVQNIRTTPPFDTAHKWQEFRDRLDKMRGVNFELTPDGDYYRAEYSDLANDEALKAFQETIAWSIEHVKSAQH